MPIIDQEAIYEAVNQEAKDDWNALSCMADIYIETATGSLLLGCTRVWGHEGMHVAQAGTDALVAVIWIDELCQERPHGTG